MGYDGFFFARIDYADKNLRGSTRNLEMVWRGSQSLGEAVDMFTGVLYYGYGPPPGFCFDVGCDDEPIMVRRSHHMLHYILYSWSVVWDVCVMCMSVCACCACLCVRVVLCVYICV